MRIGLLLQIPNERGAVLFFCFCNTVCTPLPRAQMLWPDERQDSVLTGFSGLNRPTRRGRKKPLFTCPCSACGRGDAAYARRKQNSPADSVVGRAVHAPE